MHDKVHVGREATWSYTWKQNRFKFSLESRARRQSSSVLWELIPCRKRPFSEFRPNLRLDITRRICRAQTRWTWWCICRLYHVWQVRRAAVVVRVVAYIIKHIASTRSILERTGSQCRSCRWGVMCSWCDVADEPCGGVLDSFKWLECRLRKTRPKPSTQTSRPREDQYYYSASSPRTNAYFA